MTNSGLEFEPPYQTVRIPVVLGHRAWVGLVSKLAQLSNALLSVLVADPDQALAEVLAAIHLCD